MTLSAAALKTQLGNAGVQSDMLSLTSTLDTASSVLGAMSSTIPSIDSALLVAQQAAVTVGMTAVSSLASKFAPDLLDLTSDIMTAVNTRVDSTINAVEDLTSGLDIPLPGGKAFSVNSCIALADEAIANPSLDVSSTYLKDGLSATLPGTIVAGATGALRNPYKTFGNIQVQTRYDAAGNAIRTMFKKGVPPLTPAIDCTPDTDFVKLPKEIPVFNTNQINRKLFIPRPTVWQSIA